MPAVVLVMRLDLGDGHKKRFAWIARVKEFQRHVCDAELRILAKALGVSMEWLVGDTDEMNFKTK